MNPVRGALLLLLVVSTGALGADYPFSFATEKVAEGIHAFIEPPGHAIVSGNSTAIIGEEGVLVVDSGQHPALTRKAIAEIRRLTPKPVLYVVNTHWHNDHVAGNSVYAEEFPGAKFIAHAFTARMLDSDVRPYYGAPCQGLLKTQSKFVRDMVESGKGSDGNPLTEERRARLVKVLREADVANEECAAFRYRGSDLAFEEKLTVRLGKREVQILWLGRANTAGDAVVYVPDARVVITGDILVHPFPFALHSYIGEWGVVLRRIEAMDAAAIVPGHGPVMRDRKYLVDIAELMESIAQQVKSAYRPGMSLEEMRKKVDVEKFRERIAGTNAFINANFDAMVVQSAVSRAYQEVKGALEPEAMPKG